MINIEDINYCPTLEELGEFIQTPLFSRFCEEMERTYKTKCAIEFSKCSWEYGWNIKFKKAGKNLCTLYPREMYFTVLVVVGVKEKEETERILPELSSVVREIYHTTKEGNGQRWLMIDLEDEGVVYEDVLRLIAIRRGGKPQAHS